jgi:HK97 family phage major capsid protein
MEKNNMTNVTTRMEQLANTWEHFKDHNDRRLSEIEKKGSADPLTIEAMNKMNFTMDRLKSLELAVTRPDLGSHEDLASFESSRQHKSAFLNYIRKGVESDLLNIEKKALSIAVDADGGFLVPQEISKKVIKLAQEISPMRQLASVEEISTDSLDIIEDFNLATASWSATESAAVVETATPQIGRKTILVNELYAQPKATQRLIDDNQFNAESWLIEKLAEIFAKTENSTFVNGDGVGKPKGFLTYTDIGTINSGVSAAVTADSVVRLVYSLKEDYMANATFLMNRQTVQQVRLLKDTTNNYIWNPSFVSGKDDTLFGIPVKQAVDMPIPAANANAIALADFKKAYQIVDRFGIRILRDPYTEKPFVKFYATKRVGGDVVCKDAIKFLKLAV